MRWPKVVIVPVATFNDLCIDAVDARTLGGFWAFALGLDLKSSGDASDPDKVLRGAEPGQTVWVNTVPEPKTAKQRVHLDVHTASVQDLVDAGATVLGADMQPPGGGWTMMADPEGGEFCAFVREPARLPDYRLYEMVVDCADPERIARWWGDVLGQPVHENAEEGWYWLEDVPDMPFESWVFVSVPEPKAVKNRIHWDVNVQSLDDLVSAGAVVLRPQDDEIHWTVCADPEGNEFCAFVK